MPWIPLQWGGWYYPRRFLAQMIDGLLIALIGGLVLYGTDHSSFIHKGNGHETTLTPMHPGVNTLEFRYTPEKSGGDSLDTAPREAASGGMKKEFRLFLLRIGEEPEIEFAYKIDGRWGLILVYALYYTFCTGRWGQTPGKRLLRLRVVGPEGGRVSYGRACGRWLAYYVSGVPLFLGLLWIFFNRDKRAWHDLLCRSRVVPAGQEEEALI